MIQEIKGKAQIEYPTDWKYKVIGTQENLIRKSVDEVLTNIEYKLKFSKKSSKGKFISLEISLNVKSEKERDLFFHNLKKSKNINMVI